MPIDPDDLVLVSTRGRLFYARVLGAERLGRIAIAPIERDVRVRSVALGELRGHWSNQGDPRPEAGDAGQASFDHLLDH